MKLFLVLTSAYFAICLGVVLITPGVGIAAFEGVWARAMSLVPALANAALGLFCLAVLARRFGRGRKTDGPRGLGALGSAIAMALVGTVLLQAGFLMFKTTMPSIVPFFADPPLAQWDKVLHGGTDAWVWTFAAAAHLPMDILSPAYLGIWIWPAVCLPMAVAATDPDEGRVRRTVIVFLTAWVGIGSILALAGLSAGPVFYDRIYGGDRFAELTDVMVAHPELYGFFIPIQDDLWWAYSTQQQSVGSGISAFPSVHVSVAMATALYLYERAKLLAVPGVLFVIVILFLSVFSGYHYALDGYVSIAVIWAVWWGLRRTSRV